MPLKRAKVDPPDRPNAPKIEPISLFPGCFDDILTHKAQIGPPLAEVRDTRLDPPVRGPPRRSVYAENAYL